MDLQTHYATLIDRQYQRLANPGRLHWAWSTRLFSGSDAQVLRACRWACASAWLVLMGLLSPILFLHGKALAHEGAVVLMVFFLAILSLQFFLMYLTNVLRTFLRRKSATPATEHLEGLTAAIGANPRLFALVKDMLKRDGVTQLTQAQATFLWAGFAHIDRWQQEEQLRQNALATLNRTGVVTLANSEQRAETLEEALPAAESMASPAARF